MKKFTATLLLLFMTLTASADRFEVDGIIYESKNDTEVWISSFDKGNLPEGPITIPATVTNSGMTYSVTAIGDHAFRGCKNLTSIEIPNSVTSIGNSAFWYCSGLTSITIPNSVTSIGADAFNGCDGLTSITIPNSVTSIGGLAFSGCNNLTSIVVESGNSVYDSRNNCNAIIETVTNTLISGCKNTIIPDNITKISREAFYNFINLQSITIPSSIVSIGDIAFANCSNVTSIASYVHADKLFAVIESVFQGVKKDSCVLYVPAGTKATYAATEGWNEFTNIVEMEEEKNFCGDSVYWTFDEATGTLNICGTGTMYYNKTNTNQAWYEIRKDIQKVVIENGVTTIANYAFNDCTNLVGIAIPEGITSIGYKAFSGCENLGNITIPNSVKEISRYAFENCSNITEIILSQNVDIIHESTFSGCKNLERFIIPANIDSIGMYAFENSKIENLIFENGVTSISINNEAFGRQGFSYAQIDTLDIGRELIYKADEANEISPFYGNDNIKFATIGEGAKSIGYYLFDCCTSLETVIIEEGVTEVKYQAFDYCPSLKRIQLPNSITTLGAWAFSYCKNLEELVLPANILNIGGGAFNNCTNLKVIYSLSSEPSVYTPRWAGDNLYATDVYNAATLYVPAGAKATYAATDGWKEFTNIVEMDVTIEAENISTAPGRSITLPVAMSNSEAITAFQMDLTLPEEVNFTSVTLGNDRTTESHTIQTSVLANGKRRIIAYSSKNTPFNLNEGTLLNINLDVPKETENGDYEVELSNIRLIMPNSKEILQDNVTTNINVKMPWGDANEDGEVTTSDVFTVANYILERHIGHFWFDAADVNGDGEISMGDLVAIVNIILNPDSYDYNGKMAKRGVMAESGSAISMPDTRSTEGTATVPVSLNNTTAYTAFQMDVELPEGATLASATLCDRAAGHNIAWSKLPDGKMRVVAYSTGNEAINGNAGELIALNIKAEKAVSGAINVDNVRMVTPAGTEYVIGNCGSLLDINGTTGIGTTEADKIVSVRYFNEAGVELKEPVKGVNIIITEYADGKIESKKMIVKK